MTPYVVLTAGHCVYSRDDGGYPTRIRFSPAMSEASFTSDMIFPFGNRLAKSWVTTTAWQNEPAGDSHPDADFAGDLGAVFFDAPFTFANAYTGLMFGAAPISARDAGYPATVLGQDNPGGQFEDVGTVSTTTTDPLINVNIYSSGGNSGGPYWSQNTLGTFLIGSLSAGPDTGRGSLGPHYSAQNMTLLNSWLATVPPNVPETGWWWDPTTPGRGVGLETHPTDGHVFMAVYQYGSDGTSQWAAATLVPGATAGQFFGDLQLYRNGIGQSLGPVTLVLDNPVKGRLTWPVAVGGGTTSIETLSDRRAAIVRLELWL